MVEYSVFYLYLVTNFSTRFVTRRIHQYINWRLGMDFYFAY